jgi:uncharacterized membrane protein YGL010W
MGISRYVFKNKWSQTFRITVIVLCATALAAEVLPEMEAKLIVIPALTLAVLLSLFEILKDSKVSKKS